MNTIYRREPVFHKLPTGWNDMDGVKHQLLSNISGLQQIENAAGIDKASTYNCKNVYQDDSNNLTVRPSIRPLKNFEEYDIRGYYKTTNFELWRYRSGKDYILTDGIYEAVIGPGDIAAEEVDSTLYILHTDKYGKLMFDCWDDGLQSIVPDIPTNSKDSPIGRLYNLLSNEIKVELPLDTLRVLQPSDYHSSASASVTVSVSDSYHKPFIYILNTGDIVILSTGGSYLCKYDAQWTVIALDIKPPVNGLGTRLSVFEMNVTVDDETKSGCFYVNVPIVATDSYGLIRYKVLLDGSISQSKVEIHSNVELDTNYTNTIPGYNGDFCVSTDDWNSIKVYKNGVLHQTKAFGAATVHDVKMTKDYLAVIIIYDSKYGLYVYDLANNDKYIYLQENFPHNHAFVATKDTVYLGHDDKLYYVDNDSFSSFIAPQNIAVNNKNVVATPYLILDNYVLDLDKGFRKITDDNLVAANYTGSICMTGRKVNTEWHYTVINRIPNPVYSYHDREISESFPLLSEIEDEVLTSFYLDNVYWFVTKHRIFGTGVVDEQFSIKYFDPRKYFHFDEELTAAIRVSDTSFWVFHNNGAYLIYKSSTPVYDEISGEHVEMVTWLCTSTARSKGCDFENAVLTLPILNYVSCVTADDISVAQMRENIQTDEKVLMPLTLQLRSFVSSLLRETESIITAVYKYNAIFFLNSAGNKPVSALVYNVATESWWYWELPLKHVIYASSNTDTVELVAKNETDKWYKFDLYTEYHEHTIGGLTYSIYADRTGDGVEPITWFWESAIQHLGTVEYRKQLLTTNFTLSEKQESMTGFEYSFIVYSRDKTDRRSSQVEKLVNKASTCSCKTVIGSFMYLQIRLQNQSSSDDFTGAQYTKPKFSTISFKYRILPGGVV